MTPLSRTIGLLLAAAVGTHAVAHGSSVLVCRFTGRAVEACACWHSRLPGVDRPAIEAQRCCVVRTTLVPSIPAMVKATALPTRQRSMGWEAREPRLTLAGIDRTILVAARQQAPPTAPLYLSIRSLLI